MSKKNPIKLTVPNDLGYGPVVGAFVKAVAHKLGFGQEDLQMIELGVDEAFTNVVEHAFDPDEDESFDIICKEIPLGLKIVIKEKGMPFDPSKIPEYKPETALEASGAGLGFFLMKQAMDEVNFLNLGKEGKETDLIKFLPQKSIDEYFDKDELERFEKGVPGQKPKPKEKLEMTVRLMDPGEAIEVAKCIYRTYGYSYDKEHAYYPERIVELNQTGLLISSVAVGDDGRMAAHCGLMKTKAEDRIAEIGMAVTKPKYRGQGGMKLLTAFLLDWAREKGLIGVFAQAVSNHPYSQRAMHKFGFKDCGLLLGNVPTTRSFKGITDKLEQRESYVVSFQYLNKPESLQVFAPPQHRKLIEDIYNNIGISPKYGIPDWVGYAVGHPEGDRQRSRDPKGQDDGGQPVYQVNKTVLRTRVYAGKGIAYIEIPEFGPDAVREVRRTLKDLCLKHIEMIYLYPSLQHPATYSLASEFEKLGFVCGGIFPGTSYGDVLILQYQNNVSIDHEKIALESDMAKTLSQYILDRELG